MKKLGFIIIWFSCSYGLFAQEICDNGIDDDGDGLVDFNDLDCECSLNEELLLVRNPSFEEHSCCPENVSQINCVNDWTQGSNGTTDYFHTCATIISDEISSPPLPLPDGQGIIGFYNIVGSTNTVTHLDEYKEYLGTCLSSSLIKDSLYIWDFFLGFSKEEEGKSTSISPVEIVLLGTNQCTDLPFSGSSCPLSNWVELTKGIVTGTDQWTKASFNFVAPKDIQAIIIGMGCQGTNNDFSSYYYLDRVLLIKASEKYLTGNINVFSGFPCTENVILEAVNAPNATYQWYYNKIAIPNATDATFAIPSGIEAEGDYYVKIENDEHCVFSSPYHYKIDGFPLAELGKDTILCNNTSLLIGNENFGTNFLWSTGETSPTITINIPGIYTVTVTNECGEDVDEITILEERNQLQCDFQVPNVFTPNQDGINDELSAISTCCFVDYEFRVYNRWGALVFQTNDIEQKWDGTFRGSNAPADVYIWQTAFTYQIEGKENRRIENGDVTLIR